MSDFTNQRERPKFVIHTAGYLRDPIEHNRVPRQLYLNITINKETIKRIIDVVFTFFSISNKFHISVYFNTLAISWEIVLAVLRGISIYTSVKIEQNGFESPPKDQRHLTL